jgi:hypothetical protein
MQSVTTPPQPPDVTQPSSRRKPSWPWWSVASFVLLALIVLACAGGLLAYTMRPTQAAAWPTAVLITVTPLPGPTYVVVTSAAPTSVPWSNLTRAVRVAGTQGLQLRIRSAPGTKSDTIKLVPDGTRLLIIGDGQQVEGMMWWPVRDPADNKEGWAVSIYLIPDAGP